MPLYHQVYSVLAQRISDGTYPQGTKIPTEEELTAEFAVSRATIRQAIAELARVGTLHRQQGRGTFVLKSGSLPMGRRVRGSSNDFLHEAANVTIEELSISHGVTIPTRIADALALDPPTGTIVHSRRAIDGLVFCATDAYLAPRYGESATERTLRRLGMLAFLRDQGVQFENATQHIRAVVADPVLSDYLGVAMGAAVMETERIAFDSNGEPVEFLQAWYRGDLYEYAVALDL
jgi:GntR family transcriptional regulator